MSKGLINEILNNIADLTNLQTGEVEIDIGDLWAIGRLSSDSSQLGWTIPLGRTLPKNTTITKITGNVIARAGNHNAGGLYFWRANTYDPAVFDTSVNSTFLNGANVSTSILPSYWIMSIEGNTNLKIDIISGTNYFFTGNSTNNGYCNNQPCVLELSDIKVTVDIPTNSIYVPNSTLVVDNPQTTIINNNSTTIPGTIQMYAGQIAPTGYLICDGSEISRSEYNVLFAVIGTLYGQGDGVTTFNLPDLRSRVGVGASENYSLGSQGGENEHNLTTNELPNIHGELIMGWGDSSAAGIMTRNATGVFSASSSGTTYFAKSTFSGTYNNKLILNVGSNQAHNNMQPYLAINYIIATGKND